MADAVRAIWSHARSLPGVDERTSESGDFPALYVGRVEFLHVHGTRMDLRLPPPLVPGEVARGGARPHSVGPAARDGWVEVELSDTNPSRVKELIARAHEGATRVAGV